MALGICFTVQEKDKKLKKNPQREMCNLQCPFPEITFKEQGCKCQYRSFWNVNMSVATLKQKQIEDRSTRSTLLSSSMKCFLTAYKNRCRFFFQLHFFSFLVTQCGIKINAAIYHPYLQETACFRPWSQFSVIRTVQISSISTGDIFKFFN